MIALLLFACSSGDRPYLPIEPEDHSYPTADAWRVSNDACALDRNSPNAFPATLTFDNRLETVDLMMTLVDIDCNETAVTLVDADDATITTDILAPGQQGVVAFGIGQVIRVYTVDGTLLHAWTVWQLGSSSGVVVQP